MARKGENAGKATVNRMSGRERWRRSFHFDSPDRPVNIEFGYWDETLPLWHKSGLPKEVNTHDAGHAYFGLDRTEGVYAQLGLVPPFENKVVAEGKGYRDEQESDGSVVRRHLDITTSTIPQHLSYPIKGRSDWERFKRRLNPDSPERFPDADAIRKRHAGHDYPLTISAGSLFGWIRNWMGFEEACMLPHLDPALFEEMVEHLCTLFCTVLERWLPLCEFDSAHMWEDMCFKQGPMMNPEHFRQFMVPRYKRITGLMKKHGIDVFFLDCDGNIDALVPLWLEAGVNGMFPLEVSCGSDPVKYRGLYGRDVLLFGGVNKRTLAAGRKAIDKELERLRPVVEEGGFAPHCDHRCPPDVSLDDYIYYLERKVKVFGMA